MSASNSDEVTLVTGGAGFLGNYVVERLLDRGQKVIVIDDFSNVRELSPANRGHSRFRLATVDLRDAHAVAELIQSERPTTIFHLAALHFIPTCVANPAQTIEINILGTQHLLDACAALQDPPRIVFTSTADVYRPQIQAHSEQSEIGPDNIYGLSKIVGERLLSLNHHRGLCKPVIARLFNLYGPGETNPHVIPEIVRQIKAGGDLRLGNMTPRRDFVYVADAADALCAIAATAPAGSVFNVGTGNSHSVEEIIELMGEILGRRVVVAVDLSRYRESDRPNLQCDPHLLHEFGPTLVRTTLLDGISRLLHHEGLLTSHSPTA